MFDAILSVRPTKIKFLYLREVFDVQNIFWTYSKPKQKILRVAGLTKL